MKQLIASSVLAFTLNYAYVFSAEQTVGFDVWRNGVVQIGQQKVPPKVSAIEFGMRLGTGFIIDATERCTVATAKHLFLTADRNSLAVRFPIPFNRLRSAIIETRLFYEDPSKDLAFLSLDPIVCLRYKLYFFPLLNSLSGRVFAGDDVLIIGHPYIDIAELNVPIARGGIIGSTDLKWKAKQEMLFVDLVGVAGFSGAPVIQKNSGYVIGVHYGPYSPEAKIAGYSWATPITQGDYSTALKSPGNK